MKAKFILVLLLHIMFVSHAQTDKVPQKRVLHMAATNWCPYTCSSTKEQGFVSTHLRKVLLTHGIELKITFLPWQRAISKVREGELDGLLTASKHEARGFLKTKHPTTSYQMCFYGKIKNNWKYKSSESLKQIRQLGVISSYGYGEPVDSYIDSTPSNLIALSGKNPLERLVKMIHSDRLSILIEDHLVLDTIKNHKLKIKGCLKKEPLYIAFNKKDKNLLEIINILNKDLINSNKELLKFQKSVKE